VNFTYCRAATRHCLQRPGNMGRLCYPTQAPPRICPGRPESCHGARRVWRTFCRLGTNYAEHYACRGTSLIGAENLSPVTKLVTGTGAVSRYNLSRSQKTVMVQDLNCVQMRALPTEAERRWVSGYNRHYECVLRAGAKAKSVTNNLPILSVLVAVLFLRIKSKSYIIRMLQVNEKRSNCIFNFATIKVISLPVWFIIIICLITKYIPVITFTTCK